MAEFEKFQLWRKPILVNCQKPWMVAHSYFGYHNFGTFDEAMAFINKCDKRYCYV